MTHYGFEPPWQGRSFHYGSWRKGEEMWDGSGFEWKWVPPASSMLGHLSEIIQMEYVATLQRELNQHTALFAAFQADQIGQPMTVEVR